MLIDRSYRKHPMGRAAMRLAQSVFELIQLFPDSEKSGMASMLKRTATSIPPKIACTFMQDEPADAAKALESVIVSLRELVGYLDVAQQLRMTNRRHFRRARRRANTLYARVREVLDAIEAFEAQSPQPQFHLAA